MNHKHFWESDCMCEFKVYKRDKIVFEDAVYAKADRDKVTVKNVLGISETFEGCTIAEVDVGSERLILIQTKK
jgi:predicted RNA-binding protein